MTSSCVQTCLYNSAISSNMSTVLSSCFIFFISISIVVHLRVFSHRPGSIYVIVILIFVIVILIFVIVVSVFVIVILNFVDIDIDIDIETLFNVEYV